MFGGAGGNIPQAVHAHQPQVRNFALAATGLTVLVLFLLHSMRVEPGEIEQTTRQSLRVINDFVPISAWRTQAPNITKVTALFGFENEIYEAAIRSHDEHNGLHGYELKVLRERIVDSFWSKATFLLSLIVEELAKPARDRTQWIMWLGPDIILLNKYIPLELFLPPEDFDHLHFLGTHDREGLNTGVFFLHVHEWSVRMLIEVLALPKNSPELADAVDKDKLALEMVLKSPTWRREVIYQPRTWYNAYQLDADTFEGKRGDLLVHFHDLKGDKWSAMASTLAESASRNSTWSVPLGLTTYKSEVEEYWDRIRRAEMLLDQAERHVTDESVGNAAKRLGYARRFEADLEGAMNEGMDRLRDAMESVEAKKVT